MTNRFDGQQDLFAEKTDTSKMSDEAFMRFQSSLNQNMVTELRRLFQNNKAIFIPGNTPSLKNGKEIQQIFTKQSVCCKDKGGLMEKSEDENGSKIWICSNCKRPTQRHTKPILTKNKRVMAYEDSNKHVFYDNKNHWDNLIKDVSRPYLVGMYFIRDSFRIFDHINAAQILLDMMRDVNYFPDDNVLYVTPEFLGYHVDKNNPGAIITLYTKELQIIKNSIYGLS